MRAYVECQECRFVVRATDDSTPEPERVDACPNCEGTDFAFPSERPPGPNSRRHRRSGLES